MKNKLLDKVFYIFAMVTAITLTSPFFNYKPTTEGAGETGDNWFIWGDFNLLDVVTGGLPRFAKVPIAPFFKVLIVFSALVLAATVFQFVGALFRQRKQVLFAALTVFVFLLGGLIYVTTGSFGVTIKTGYYLFMVFEAAVVALGIYVGKKQKAVSA